MSLPYSSSGWNTHSEVQQPEFLYPIARDLSARWLRRRYEGPAATYTDLALDTADDVFTNYYFVQQGPLENLDGGQVAYERIWANIPNIRDEYETTTYEYPAVQITATPTALDITAMPATNIITVPTHSFTVGQRIGVSVTYQVDSGALFGSGFTSRYTVLITAISGNDITVALNLIYTDPNTGSPYAFTFRSGQVISAFTAGRDNPQVIETQAVVRHEYFLPGVTGGISSPSDIPLEERFSVLLGSTGVEVNSVSALTSPNTTRYRDMVINKELLVDSSTVRPWTGNIYEKITRFVIAR